MLASSVVPILWLFPAMVASLYFSRRLSNFTLILTMVISNVCQILSASINGTTAYSSGVGTAVFVLDVQLIVMILLFNSLVSRTTKMFSNFVDSESKQRESLSKIENVIKKSQEVSEILNDSINQLHDVTNQVMSVNETVAANLNNIAEESENITDTIGKVDKLNEASGKMLAQAASNMNSTEEVTKLTKAKIHNWVNNQQKHLRIFLK